MYKDKTTKTHNKARNFRQVMLHLALALDRRVLDLIGLLILDWDPNRTRCYRKLL